MNGGEEHVFCSTDNVLQYGALMCSNVPYLFFTESAMANSFPILNIFSL